MQPKKIMLLSCGDTTPKGASILRKAKMHAICNLPYLEVAQIGASRLSVPKSDKSWLQLSANKSQKIFVRDHYSRALLNENHIKTDIIPDLAFLLDFRGMNRGRKIMFMFRAAERDENAFTKKISSLVKAVKSLGFEPTFGWQVSRDATYNTNLAKKCGAEVYQMPKPEVGRREETLNCYEEVAAIISDRLHGLLIAASSGAVPIPLIAREERKVRGVFEQSNLGHLILESNASEDYCKSFIEKRMAQRYQTSTELEAAFTKNAATIEGGLDDIFLETPSQNANF